MPTVLGINQVPPNTPRPTGFDYGGQLSGAVTRQITDLLLAALVGRMGSVPTTPTPQRPGSLTFPSGASTPTSPGELAQIQGLGGVPTQQGMVGMGQPQTGGVSYNPPTRMGLQPDFSKVLNQLKIQEAQRSLDPSSPENQVKVAMAEAFRAQAKQGQPSSQGSVNPAIVSSLRDMALQGDEDAIAMLRQLGVL